MRGFTEADQALTQTKHAKPDVLLMDFQLNDEHYNGVSLAKALRESWGEDIPVCIISAAAEPELPNIAKGQGFSFLQKPVKPAKLRAWLNHIAGKKPKR